MDKPMVKSITPVSFPMVPQHTLCTSARLSLFTVTQILTHTYILIMFMLFPLTVMLPHPGYPNHSSAQFNYHVLLSLSLMGQIQFEL